MSTKRSLELFMGRLRRDLSGAVKKSISSHTNIQSETQKVETR